MVTMAAKFLSEDKHNHIAIIYKLLIERGDFPKKYLLSYLGRRRARN